MLKVNPFEQNYCLLWRFKVLKTPQLPYLTFFVFPIDWLVVVCLFSCSREFPIIAFQRPKYWAVLGFSAHTHVVFLPCSLLVSVCSFKNLKIVSCVRRLLDFWLLLAVLPGWVVGCSFGVVCVVGRLGFVV